MSRDDFLRELRSRIGHLPQEELDAAMAYYQEYFDECGDDAAAWEALGSPAEAAARILGDYEGKDNAIPKEKKKGKGKSCLIAFCIVVVLLFLVSCLGSAGIGEIINSDTLDPDYDPYYVDEDGFWDWSDFDFDDSNTIETTAEEKVMGLEHFNNIKAQLEVTELFLEDGEEYSLSIMEGAGRSFTYKVENDTLILKENSKDKHLNNTSSRVVITIPKDTHLHQVEIGQGVGNVVIYDLSAHELNINSGVGNTDLKRIDVDELSIDGGVGNIEGDDLSVTTELDLNSGVGTISLHGDFCGEIDLDSGMGNVELFFARPQSNYLIDIENGLGTVKINGEKYKSGEYHQGNAVAEHKIDIENGTGSMELTFEE